MDRRTVLRGVNGLALALGGCLGSSGEDQTSGFVRDRSVNVTETDCGDRENSGSVSYDGNGTVAIEGVLSTDAKCGPLAVSAFGCSEDCNSLILDVHPTGTAECESCRRYFEYEATVDLRREPDVVRVVHSDPELLAAIDHVNVGTTETATSEGA